MTSELQTVEIRTAHVKVQNGALQIDAYLAEPVGEGPFPAIVVLQEIFGVNEHIRDVSERFAKAGFVAIAPALYQRVAPGFETGYTPDDITVGRQYKDQTKAEELLGDIEGAIAYLKTLPSVKPGSIGAIGFCFGGHVAYLAATLPDIKATASFYGAGIPTMLPGGGDPTVTRTSAIHGTLHLFFGLDDPSIPPEHIEQIESALQEHHVSYQIFRYPGAQHGFFCDRRASYNADAASDAWNKALALFRSSL
ncbi:MAG TPA: dienelactone hydrolase family protein [Crinalium sp.]|jgi:carboxymethylenebutenolidase